MKLTKDEAALLLALHELEKATYSLHVQPIIDRLQLAVIRIEKRLKLPPGSIGQNHLLDIENGILVENESDPRSLVSG